MQFDSSSAHHKLAFVALLVVLFAAPFIAQWHAVSTLNTKAFIAGGAVIGNDAFTKTDIQSNTNYAAGISTSSGASFIGELVQ